LPEIIIPSAGATSRLSPEVVIVSVLLPESFQGRLLLRRRPEADLSRNNVKYAIRISRRRRRKYEKFGHPISAAVEANEFQKTFSRVHKIRERRSSVSAQQAL
jgi:hypothetical protein